MLATLLTAGDDYEIVAAVPEASAAAFEAEATAKGVPVTTIGRIAGMPGRSACWVLTARPLELDRKGFAHF